MQEVFEKIIEKLNEEMVCYFLTIANTVDKSLDVAYEKVGKAIDKAIEIVKQEATEYNNGWIPCSERLPENVDHLADGDKKKQYLVMTRNGRYEVAEWLEVYDKPFWCGHYSQEIKDVIRWKPLEPYQPNGE